MREGSGGQADPARRRHRVRVPARGPEGVRGGEGPRGTLLEEGAATHPGDKGQVSDAYTMVLQGGPCGLRLGLG